MKSADLYYTDGGSDKEYHAKIEKEGTGYVVNISYGRRGTNLATGAKTDVPVSLEEAEKVFDKVVREKTSKGYTASITGAVVKAAGGGALKPMLCQPCTVEDARLQYDSTEWVVERKLDGVRAYIQGGRLYDRRGVDITKRFPEFSQIETIMDVLDGEIVAQSGEFSDVSGRMHLRDEFKVKILSKKSPAIFVAFDIVVPGVRVTNRIAQLSTGYFPRGIPRFDWMNEVPRFSDFEDGWDKVNAGGWEGLILKQRDSVYQEGKRSADWLKVKAFAEATAVFVKLENHPRGVRLETADGRSVNVNGAQADEVKERFKKNGKVKCEVQYLPQNNSDAWRFPSFRGLVE